MIVTIDGPAGAGKSSVARCLATRLGFRFLDTGAMYRAVALAATRRQVDWTDDVALAELAGRVSITLESDRVLLDGQDVTDEIRAQSITARVRHIADNPAARSHLVALQRRLAGQSDVVTEGRDQGTVAFPDADCKIYLTASPEERARRRELELRKRGESVSVEEVLAQQQQRDRQDESRPVGTLKPADDAVLVNTDDQTLTQVVDRLERLVRSRMHEMESEKPNNRT